MVYAGLKWPNELAGVVRRHRQPSSPRGDQRAAVPGPPDARAFIELAKLIIAVLVGLLVSAIHQPSPRERPSGRSMEQAQTLLCVSGAMMMIIIGNSLVRAFGIAGAASIIRFRTPVDDPKDVTILFLLMSLGMSTGLGSLAVAGLGTAFLCITLLVLDHVARQSARVMAGRDRRQRPRVPDDARRGRVRAQSDHVRTARDHAVRRCDDQVPDLAVAADLARRAQRVS